LQAEKIGMFTYDLNPDVPEVRRDPAALLDMRQISQAFDAHCAEEQPDADV
jgi:hypothetical protein